MPTNSPPPDIESWLASPAPYWIDGEQVDWRDLLGSGRIAGAPSLEDFIDLLGADYDEGDFNAATESLGSLVSAQAQYEEENQREYEQAGDRDSWTRDQNGFWYNPLTGGSSAARESYLQAQRLWDKFVSDVQAGRDADADAAAKKLQAEGEAAAAAKGLVPGTAAYLKFLQYYIEFKGDLARVEEELGKEVSREELLEGDEDGDGIKNRDDKDWKDPEDETGDLPGFDWTSWDDFIANGWNEMLGRGGANAETLSQMLWSAIEKFFPGVGSVARMLLGDNGILDSMMTGDGAIGSFFQWLSEQGFTDWEDMSQEDKDRAQHMFETGEGAHDNKDTDGDGIPDSEDLYPDDPNNEDTDPDPPPPGGDEEVDPDKYLWDGESEGASGEYNPYDYGWSDEFAGREAEPIEDPPPPPMDGDEPPPVDTGEGDDDVMAAVAAPPPGGPPPPSEEELPEWLMDLPPAEREKYLASGQFGSNPFGQPYAF